MARSRQYGEDLTYSEWHRHRLPALYERIGHRLDMADRDFTEFCSFCKEPLLICELVRDVGQDLRDKATTVTRRLAARSRCSAVLLGWRVERSPEIQAEIDELHRRIRVLEQQSPIVRFTVRGLWPQVTGLQPLTPDQWAQWVLLSHREHHAWCPPAREHPVHHQRFEQALTMHPFHRPSLFDGLRLP